ncbi:MAG: hypothetical protein AAFU80_21470 [Pseudomonadota bacterium]
MAAITLTVLSLSDPASAAKPDAEAAFVLNTLFLLVRGALVMFLATGCAILVPGGAPLVGKVA